MRKLFSFSVILLISLIGFTLTASAQTIPSPNGSIYVQDFSSILSSEQKEELIELGQYIDNEAKVTISLVTIDSLNGHGMDDFSKQMATEYKLDQNGILLLIAVHDRKIQMEVGSGWKSTLTDEQIGEILNTYALPYLENNEMANALTNSYKEIFNDISDASNLTKKAETKKLNSGVPSFFIILIIIGGIGLLLFIDKHFFKGVFAITLVRFIRKLLTRNSRMPKNENNQHKQSTRRPPNRRPPTNRGL